MDIPFAMDLYNFFPAVDPMEGNPMVVHDEVEIVEEKDDNPEMEEEEDDETDKYEQERRKNVEGEMQWVSFFGLYMRKADGFVILLPNRARLCVESLRTKSLPPTS